MKKIYLFIGLISFLFLGNQAQAQSGPGGVGSDDGTSDLELWLKADSAYSDDASTVAGVGDRVQVWPDQSGYDNDARQTFGRRPFYQEITINSKQNTPVIQFDGNNDRFEDVFTLSGQFNTIITVFAHEHDGTDVTSEGPLWSLDNGAEASGFFPSFSGSSYIHYGSGWLSDATPFTQNIFYNSTVVYDNSFSGLYVDGDLYMSQAENSITTSDFWIGRRDRDPQDDNYFDGYIAEMIFYSRALNDAERIIVENYIASKYNLSTINDYFAYDDAYFYDVAGIGRVDASNLHNEAQSGDLIAFSAASDLDDDEFVLFGHDNAALTWSSTDSPEEAMQRVAREWRIDETGDVGTITVQLDSNALTEAIPAGYYGFELLVDADGDFASGATAYQMTDIGSGIYEATGVEIAGGNYITIGVYEPRISFSLSASSISESTANIDVEVTLNYLIGDDITVDFAIDGGSTATGSGTDYTLNSSSPLTITGGNLTNDISFTITTADTDLEVDETIIINLSNPSEGELGTISTHTLTINDDDAGGYSGPGGVGDNANNKLWIKADALSYSDDDPVTDWADDSGNGNDFAQGTGALQPTFKTSVINGWPVVRFDGTNEMTAPDIISGTTGRTIFILGKVNGSIGNSGFIELNKNRAGGSGASYLIRGEIAVRVSGYKVFDESLGTSNFRLLTVKNGNGENVSDVLAYLEGTSLGQSALSDVALNTSSGGTMIGGYSDSNIELDGDIAEIIIFNEELNTARQTIVETYLAAKYNLSHAAAKYAYGSTHYYDVAGIGRESSSDLHTKAQSAALITIGNASGLDDAEYLVFGHDNGAVTAWTSNETPEANMERIAREWRFSETGGDVGTLNIAFDHTNADLAALSADYYGYLLLVDEDGDFSSGADVYQMTLSGGEYVAEGVNIEDGNFITIATYSPSIEFTVATDNAFEGSSPLEVCLDLTYPVNLDVEVTYTINAVTTTATNGTDFSLTSPETAVIAAGDTTVTFNISIIDDVVEESEEFIVLDLSGPVNASLGDFTTITITLGDNDNQGFVGPGGVGNANNNKLWLMADKDTTLDANNRVITWGDQSGNAHDANNGQQWTRATMQSYTINTIADVPALAFDGNNDRYEDIFDVPGRNLTIFSVFKHTPDGDLDGPVWQTADEYFSGFFPKWQGDDKQYIADQPSGWMSQASEINDDVWFLSTVRYSAGSAELYLDGILSQSSTNNSINIGKFRLGRRTDDGAEFDGQLAEIIVYSTDLSESRKTIVENYLAAKYNFTITNDKYTHQATHRFDVAGIGRESSADLHTAAQSAGILKISNATELSDGDYMLFGHDNGDTASWTSTESPSASYQRLAREWRVNISGDGDIGTITITLDTTDFPDLPANYYGYLAFIDADGDFSDGATAYQLTKSGDDYTANTISIADGNYIAFGIYRPTIQFTATSSSGPEGASPVELQVELDYTITDDVTVDYAVNGSSTADGSGTDYTLADGTLTITAGNASGNISISIADDTEVESAETIVVDLADPTIATLGTNTTHTFTLNDNDNAGFTGPAGIGNASNNVLWLKADAGAYNDAGSTLAADTETIQEWHDQSGNDNDVGQTTGALKPVFNASGIDINDKPYISFDGSDDFLSGPSVLSGNIGRSIYVVAKMISDNGTHDGLLLNLNYPQDGGNGNTYSITTETAIRVNGNNIYDQSFGTSDYRVLSIDNADGADIVDVDAYLDGTLLGTSSSSAAVLNTGNNGISLGYSDHVTTYLDGNIAEVIVYNQQLNNAQRIILENYLAAKYDLTVANAFYSYAESFGNDVAGIGQYNLATSDLHNQAQSAGFLTISNPSDMEDGEYLLFGHNNADFATWTSTETPSGANEERLAREWRVSETGDLGTISITIDASLLPALSADYQGYVLLVDADGDFSDGATAYAMENSGGDDFTADNIVINDGNYITIISFKPIIQFTNTTTAGAEGTSPVLVEVSLNYALGADASVTYNINGSSTATGSGTDYTLATPGTATISSGSTTAEISVGITDDTDVEGEETIIIDISGPTNAFLGDNDANTITISDNDNDGFVGPGGVGDANNNKLWLMADKDTTLESGNNRIINWGDQSGNGNDASQNNSWRRATLEKLDFNTLTSVPVASFNGTSNRYEDIFSLSTRNLTIFTVFKHTPDNDYDGPIWQTADVYVSGFFPKWDANGNQYVADQSSGWMNKASEFNDDVWYLATVRYGTDTTELFKDGALNDASSNNSINIGGFRLGRRTDVQGAESEAEFDGKLAEIAVYTSSLNNTQRIIIENYLAAKYNIDISASGKDYYAHQSTHRYAVAGIGQTDGAAADVHTAAQSDSILKISNASDLDDDEFLFFGNDSASISWAAAELPGTSLQRIAREWRVDETGDIGTVTITLDPAKLDAIPANHYGYLLFVNNSVDGNFTGSTTIYQMEDIGGGLYEVENIDLDDGSYISFGVYQPEIQFTLASSVGSEGSSPAVVQVIVNYAIDADLTVDYAVNGSSTAAGSGTDYTLADGTATIAAGDTASLDISIALVDDSSPETDETIIIDLSNPTAGAVIGTNVQHTFSILDNDNIGFTGPGGVGDADNNKLWLMADTDVYNDAGSTDASNNETVQEWHDQSGNGNDVSQITGDDRPTFKSSDININNKPYLSFTGDDFLTGPSVLSGNTGRNVFIVGKLVSEHGTWNGCIMNLNYPKDNQNGYEYSITPEVAIRVNGNNVMNTGFGTSDYRILSIDEKDGANVTEIGAYLDGVKLTTSTSVEATINTGNNGVSIGYSDHVTEYFIGNIAEIVIYDNHLDTAQRYIVENYLAAKYNLNVNTNLYNYKSTHGNNVAGIGKYGDDDLHPTAMSDNMIKIGNARNLDNGEYLLFGNDGGSIASWSSDEVPDAVVKRLEREWRFDATGDPGAINITLDVTNLPALGGSDVGYLLLIDSDGDFSDGSTIYTLEDQGGNEYLIDSIPITDGNFMTIGVFEPVIEFSSATTNAIEGSSPANVQVTLNYAFSSDASVDYAVDISSTATGSGTDYTLADGTITVVAGNKTANIAVAIADDTEIESEETVVIDISNPTNASLGTTTRNTLTISDNDNIGFTGPGGVGDASVNKLWFKADYITGYSDGELLDTWQDASGNGNDGNETFGRRPTYVENELNSLPVVQFDGTNDRFSDLFTVPVQNATIFTVFKHTPDGNLDGPVWQMDNAYVSGFFPKWQDNDNQYLAYNTTQWISKESEFLNNIWYTTTVLYGQDTTALFKDGTLNQAIDENAVSIGDFQVGRRPDDGAEFDGAIAELIFYSTALNETQRNIVDNYLAAKYNLSIANDYYAWQDNYGFELAGIGQESTEDYHTTAESGVIRLSNANDLGDGEYMLFGHNNGAIDSWTTTGSPNASTIQKLAREWRLGVTGDPGTVKITLDPDDLASIPTNYYGYLLLVDTDGDFTEDAQIYQMEETGGKYEVTNLTLYDGNFITFAVYRPAIEFTLSESNGSEGASPVSLEVKLNYTVPVDISADYQASLTSTATGGGVDFTLNSGTVTITSGNLTAIMAGASFTLNDDGLVEVDETVIAQLSNPSPAAAVIGDNDIHTFTINDNDNVGFTGPAGVGDANNNKLWLRADQGVFNDAGSTEASNNETVQEWHDQSGNDNDVTQTTGTAQATFKSSGTDINNKPYLSFDGSDMYTGPSILSGNTGRNIFIVTKMISPNGAQEGLIFSLSDAGGSGNLYSVTPEAAIRISGYAIYDEGLGISNYRLVTIDEADGAFIADVDMYLEDNVLGKNPSATEINTGNNNIKIGYSNHISQYYIGNIAEIVVYDDQLNTTQRRIINNYLGAKYRIDLANDYYDYDVDHGNDVAGIGQYASDDLHPKAQSADLITVSNASDLNDGEYLLFGHDGGAIDTWTTTESPTASQRLTREWRVGKTGAPGTVTVAFDHTASGLPGSVPIGYEGYSLFVDSDGDFSTGATSYRMSLSDGEYVVENISLDDGNYFTIGVESPIVQFASATNIGIEGSSPKEIEVVLNFAIDSDVTVDYAVDAESTTATEGVAGDFVLSSGTLTIPSGATSAYINVIINDDSDIEFEETVDIELSNPSNATIGEIDSTLLTISDNDDIGFTGPGGVGNANTNKLWVSADYSGNLVDVDVVTTWADKSGNGNDATQSGVRRPTLVSDELNGFAVLRFDGGNDRYEDIFTFPGRSITVFTVFKYTDVDGPLWQTAANEYSGFYPKLTGGNQRVADLSDNWLQKVSEFNSDIWYLGTVKYAENSTQLFQDGVLNHSSSNNEINIGQFRIGQDVSSNEFEGDVAEMIVFITDMNETQRNIIENMLAAKYNLTIANDYYAYQSYHLYDVAGIGKESDTDFHPAAQSADILKISNASDLDDDEYILFGHNNADISTWSDLISVPDEYHKRLERTWRADLTGTPGSISVSIDQDELPAIPANYNGYLLMVDGDGNFSSGATIYPMSLAEGRYKATDVTVNDGNYLAIAVYKPVIEFVASSSNGPEGASPVQLELSLNYAQKVDVTVNYSDAGGGTATGSGTDYLLNAGQVTIAVGETSGYVSFSLVDDTELEDEETVRVLISTPANAVLGDITTHTFTIFDNDNEGFTGPGGVGDYEVNKLWITADSITGLADDDAVSSWPDISGNGFDFAQATGANQPTYKTGIINSKPIVRFDGTDDFMTASSILAGNIGRSIFMVSKINDAGGSYNGGLMMSLDHPNGGAGNGTAYSITPEVALRVNGNRVFNEGFSVGNSALLTLINADGSDVDETQMWLDGVAGTEDSNGPASLNTGANGVAIGYSDHVSDYFDGDHAEIIVFNKEVNTTQRIIIENYLAAKYNIDISTGGNDYYAYEGTHPNNVAGIGQTSSTDQHVKAQSGDIVTVSNANDLNDGEFLLIGDDGGLLDDWNTKGTGAPNAATSLLKRAWRISETGDVGTIKISLETIKLPAIPAGSNGYFLLVDADGDFTSGATSYFMDELSGTYYANSVAIEDGDYFTFAVAEPVIQFALTASSGDEGGSPVLLEVELSYAIEQAASVDYSVDGASTADGGGVDFTLADGTISIPSGETSANISITLNDDIDVEPEETIVVNLDGPATNATLGTNDQHTYTITDNDNNGYVGPGGVGGADNNLLWLKADAGTSTTTAGSRIETWADQSGNGNDATNGNANQQPEYEEIVKGSLTVPVAEFEAGNNDRYPNVFTVPSKFMTVFTVFYHLTTGEEGFLWQAASQEYSGFNPLEGDGNHYVADQEANWVSDVSAFSADTWYIGTVRYGTDTTELYRNDDKVDGSNNNSISIGEFQIGSQNGNSNNFEGYIAEMIYYSNAINDAQFNIVNNYLAAKYDLTITNDKYAHDATHRYDVAGIGRESLSAIHTAAQSAGLIKISNASDMDDGEYLFFGHDNGLLTWTGTEIPYADGLERIAREWKFDHDGGDVGNVVLTLDITDLDALPAGYSGYFILVDTDGDGDFTTGSPTINKLTRIEGSAVLYESESLSISDNALITVATAENLTNGDGDWSEPATWLTGVVPSSTESVTISAGDSIWLTEDVSIASINISGALNINDFRLTLTSGSITNTGNFYTGTSGTVRYGATGAQSIADLSYSNFEISGSGVKTLQADLDLPGNLRLIGGELDVDSWNINLEGDYFNVGGTLNEQTGTVTFDGAGTPQSISGEETFYNLVLNNANGLNLQNNTTINNLITLTNGKVTLGTADLIIGASAATAGVDSTSRYFVATSSGFLRKVFTSNGAYKFEIGDDTRMMPVNINLTDNSGLSSAYIRAKMTIGQQPFIDGGFTNYLSGRYYTIEGSGITSSFHYNVGFYYLDSDFEGDESLMVMAKYSDGSWAYGGEVNTTTNYLYATGIASFSDFTGSDEGADPLPVDLLNFDAAIVDGNVALKWRTAYENNSDRFIVQRSVDGVEFENIGEKQAVGFSNSINDYTFYDESPVDGIAYYRLLQLDYDGKMEYSEVVSIVFTKFLESQLDVLIYPNPVVDNRFNLLMSGCNEEEEFEVVVFDMMGSKVYQSAFSATKSGEFRGEINPIRELKGGIYIINAYNAERVLFRKRIIVK